MLKVVSSNDADWIRDLRFILIAAQKNYVLDAPLGARPAAGATPDVMNVWQSKADDYSIVQCAMLYVLGFVTPIIGEVSLGPLSNAHHLSLASIATNELVAG